MNLRSFHLVFITCSIALSFLFGVWVLDSPASAGLPRFAAGSGAFAVALALIAYEAWFLRKSKAAAMSGPGSGAERRTGRGAWLSAVATTWLLTAWAAAPAAACSVCFGTRDTGSALVSGARSGVVLPARRHRLGAGRVRAASSTTCASAPAGSSSTDVASEWAQLQRSALAMMDSWMPPVASAHGAQID